MSDVKTQGLEGVVAATTRLSSVDGEAGELLIAGFPVEELAPRATFEETTWLLWHDSLPTAEELDAFRRRLAGRRVLPTATLDLLRAAARRRVTPMDALRMAAGTLSLSEGAGDPREDAVILVAAFPMIVAAYWRLLRGAEPLAPREDLGHAASFLYSLTGEEPAAERARGLETYLNTVSDHGLNASTFTARVIVSTQSDLISGVTGAVGALKGPLHGGAPGPALDMVFEIGSPERAEPVLREKLARGERLMGFGHRVYRVRDPRADVLAAAAERFYRNGGDEGLYELARSVEATALRLLRESKPDRRLDTNVEFYTALLLHGLGLPTALFTPLFAVGRVAGWTAHALEQLATGRLIRPQSEYVGERGRRWVAVGERQSERESAAVVR
ncbi:MAG TPA: citrate synthase/methylcitrate synthase [Thermoanaerobaculia bacterium]|jgi:citrate synthase|nr:citrate synthase/methylcitrate synthase [Thermoanaerobaculia bacterium]